MNMLSGQGRPDVLCQLENLSASYFCIQIVEIPNETQEAVSTVQLASQAIRVEKKPMVIFSRQFEPRVKGCCAVECLHRESKHATKNTAI